MRPSREIDGGQYYPSGSQAGYYYYDPAAVPPYIYGINPNIGVSGTPGYIEIYGSNLAPQGTTPQVSMTGANLWIVYQSDNQINVYYGYVGVGQQSLSVTTIYGTSNYVLFTALTGDPTPSVSGISPEVWPAGTTTDLTITGTGFGTNPGLTISGGWIDNYGVYSGWDTGIHGWVTVSPYAPTQPVTVTVTSNGYWGNPFLPQYPNQPNYGSATATLQAAPQPPTVAVLSASIPDDRIRVVLAPEGVYGTLTVELLGGTNYTVFQGGRSGGTYDISFNIPNLPAGEFTQVRATWAVDGAPDATREYHFRVMGSYRHTQYNTPAEGNCIGAPSSVTVYNNSCAATPNASMKSGFIDRVLNLMSGTGSGHSLDYGDVRQEFYCTPRPYPTARRDQTISGSMGPVNDSTVAVHSSSPMHEPGAQIYIHGVGVKTVTDTCGVACQGVNRIDHYTTNTACSGITDLLPEPAMTIRLY